MKLNKSQRSNLILLLILAILFFTPLGGIIKEKVLRLVAFSPSIENVEDRVQFTDYNWQLKGLNTDNYDFNSAKNKVVFVNFWATWCPSCRAEMPEIQALYDAYKDKVEFVFISNEKSEAVTSFLTKNGYNIPVYNTSRYPTEFNVTSIPATYLLDKNGKIVVHKVGAADWNSDKVHELIDQLLTE